MTPPRPLWLALALLVAGPAPAATPALLPRPAELTAQAGDFALAGAALAPTADAGTAAAAARFATLMRQGGGAVPSTRANGTIHFRRDPGIAGAEAYRLAVTPAGVTVSAATDAGLFYGAETLWQLAANGGTIPAVRIADRPAHGWRGLMLDSARHMQPVAWIEQLLDRMAEAKLNIFHWHLTDDQGWRVEIKRYPRLTQVGAWRHEAGSGARYGGFYTQAEIRRVVAYAAARHITVVPEVDLPGHATALVAAYPALGSTATPPREPSNEWGILPNLLNTEEPTFRVVEGVLDELMALFPGRYLHLGGDEAPKGQWRADPRAQARIKALRLKDEDALQGWFTARLARYLEAHGRRLIGWDEILEGAVPTSATVMSWRGVDGAIAAARAGHDAVLAPAPILYLDNRQSDAPDEPPGRGEIVDWRRLHGFTVPAAMTPADRAHLLGIQANLWTERVRTTAQADRMLWPRAAIAAELGWSSEDTRDWAAFQPNLLAALGRWDRLGWAWDRTPLQVVPSVERGAVALHQPAGIGTLRLTLNGTVPTPASPAYTAPVPLNRPVTMVAQAFIGDRPIGTPLRWQGNPGALFVHTGAELTLCGPKLPLRLEDTHPAPEPRSIHWVDAMARCWRWPAAPLDGVTGIAATVASGPFNYAFGNDPPPVDVAPATTAVGELEIRQDGCDGPRLAVLPLSAAAGRAGGATYTARLAAPVTGPHELCFVPTGHKPAPLWTLDRVVLDHGPGRP